MKDRDCDPHSQDQERLMERPVDANGVRKTDTRRVDVLMREKICSLCNKNLPLTSFHLRRHYTRSGYRAACKDCTREVSRKSRAGKKRVENEATRIKERVRQKTRRAVSLGLLVAEPCAVCSKKPVHAHHLSYVGEDAHLEVEWLCPLHHAAAHSVHGWTKQLELIVDGRFVKGAR